MKSYEEFLTESAGLTSLEVFDEMRRRFPRARTHFELLKRYIQDKHDFYAYQYMMDGVHGTDLARGYILALKEMCALVDACEYNNYHNKKGS